MTVINSTDIGAVSQLIRLRLEHRDLDLAIEALRGIPDPDQLHLARMKKRKLRLRDEIARIEGAIVPDLTA